MGRVCEGGLYLEKHCLWTTPTTNAESLRPSTGSRMKLTVDGAGYQPTSIGQASQTSGPLANEGPRVRLSTREWSKFACISGIKSIATQKKNRRTPSNNIALCRHTNRWRKRLRIHRNRLSLRHILHSFPIRSLVNEFLTLDLALSDQLDAVNQALESARLYPERVALEPTLRKELVDLREELRGKGDALRFAVCAKWLGPADLQAVEPGDEDPV
jgi:hypothetical protein